MASADANDTAVTLPRRSFQLIDRAFNRAVAESEAETASHGERPQKRRRTTQSDTQTPSGGFILDEQESSGGFIPDDGGEHQDSDEITHIPLSAIPRALQLLDLPPDDAEVLDVFANAASGWRVSTDQDDGRPASHDAVVSRRDWHAVCAVILPAVLGQHRGSDDEQSQPDSLPTHNASDSSDSDGTTASEEEYLPERTVRHSRLSLAGSRTKGLSQRKARSPSDNNVIGLQPLTARQEHEALSAFALFFPDISRDEKGDYDIQTLAAKQVTIKDVASAAASIREKLSAEEIIEMLAFFSSSQCDPSLSLMDFKQMMLATRLA